MHLKASIDIIQFLDQVAKCRGKVMFTTTEGDIINLKSTLSRYVFIFLSNRPDIMTSGTILCSEEADNDYLTDYFQEACGVLTDEPGNNT